MNLNDLKTKLFPGLTLALMLIIGIQLYASLQSDFPDTEAGAPVDELITRSNEEFIPFIEDFRDKPAWVVPIPRATQLAMLHAPFSRKRLDADPVNTSLQEPGDPIAILKLEGLLWAERYPKAIINQKIVKVGDTFGNYEVRKIATDHVILESGKDRLVLKLPKRTQRYGLDSKRN